MSPASTGTQGSQGVPANSRRRTSGLPTSAPSQKSLALPIELTAPTPGSLGEGAVAPLSQLRSSRKARKRRKPNSLRSEVLAVKFPSSAELQPNPDSMNKTAEARSAQRIYTGCPLCTAKARIARRPRGTLTTDCTDYADSLHPWHPCNPWSTVFLVAALPLCVSSRLCGSKSF